MFFDPSDYLAADPAKADSAREAERLRREAEQRARLCEATTRLAAENGLEGAPIHLAAQRAGIGQGTYYKLYDSRDACLQEAFERCAEMVFARVAEAAAEDEGSGARIEGGLGELLDLLAADRDVAQLLLTGILAGDPSCRMARERALGRFAALLTAGCGGEEAARRGGLAWLAGAAIASTLALWLARADAPPRAQMLEELLGVASWVQRGAAVEAKVAAEPEHHETGGETPRTAPESRGEARRRRERREQRKRILAAMVAQVGKRGYRTASLEEVLRRAGVSAPLFYTHFESKKECLLEAFGAEVAAIGKQVDAAVAGAESCAERAERGLKSLLEALAAGPEAARLVMIEVKAVGRAGEQRFEQALLDFVATIGAEKTDEVAQMTARVIAGTIASEVGEGRASELAGLLPELVFIALAPYLGGEEATERARAVRMDQAR